MANRVQLEAVLKVVNVQINPGVFNNISRSVAGLPGPVQQFNRGLTQSVSAANNVTNSVRRVNNQLTNSEKLSRLFLQRMAQFAILLPTFATLNKSIQGGVKFLFEFDSAIKEIIKADVGKLSGKFDEIADKAFKLSNAFGFSATESADVIKTYVQAGFDLAKASELASLSLLGVRASTLETGQSVEYLLSVTKQFKLQGQDLTRAMDALVNVEGVSAVEARDVADAYSTAGNSFAQFAKNNNDAIGLVSALREQTRKSGNEIGTFFKTLQARIFAAGESRSAIESLGVSVQNLDGTLRPTLDVLNDLKAAFEGTGASGTKMSEAEVANAAKAIAGVRQFESLLGVLNSLERANQLSVLASNSAGAAREKEAIDAQKLNRRFDDLVVAAQKLAFTLGENGGNDFLKNTLKSATSLIGILTKIVELFDKIKVPILPVLAPLALKGLGSVFGLTGTGNGGKNNIQGSRGASNAGVVQNAVGMQQLATVVSQLTQQMRILMQATMTQSQLVQSNIALDQIKNRASSLNIAAINQGSTAFKGTAKIWTAQQTIMSTYLPTFQKFGNATAGLIGSTKNIQNAGARFAVQYALLTVGTTIVTAGLNKLGEALGGSKTFGGTLSEVTAAGVQLGGQFAALGPEVAAAAGVFGTFSSIVSRYAEEVEKNKIAFKQEAEDNIRQDRLKFAPKVLSGGAEGLDFLKTFGKSISGRTNKHIDFDKSFSQAFTNLSPATKSFIKDIGDLKEALLAPGLGKETIRALSQLDSAAFVNKEAIEKLRASYDESGKSSLNAQEQLNLFLHALGEVDEEIDKTTGQIKSLILTFKDMQELQALIEFAQSVDKLGRAFDEASTAPENLMQGIDKLRAEAGFAKEDLIDAQRAFEALRKSLITQRSGEAGLDVEDAEKFVSQLNDILNKPNNGQAINDFLSSKNSEQRKFAEEFIKIDEKRRNAVIKGAETQQAFEVEIYKRGIESTKAQKEAAFAAADALSKFKNELIKVGTTSGDTGLIKQITSLTSEDVSGVLAGKSNLSDAIQSVINDTFVDGVKKAEINLSKISDETANSIEPLELRMKDLREQIAKLGDVQPDTENSAKKQALEQELAAKALERQSIEQDGFIKSLEGLRTLTVETKKAQEEASKAEADRLKKTQALTDATYSFSKAIHDVNKEFEQFTKQKIEDLAQKQASSYEELKTSEQGVLSATQDVSSAYKDYISTIIQVNGVIAEAKIKANLLGRDIGTLNGGIVTFKDKLGSLNSAFTSVLNDSNMKLEQRIQLERQLAEQTLAFLQQAQDQITNAGINVFGQSAQENQGLQKGVAGLSFIVDKLGGTFQNFLGMNSQQIGSLSKELLNLPVEFRKSILDALSFLPSTTSIGGFSADQLKQAIGQIGAGIAPEQGLPAISDLTAQQVDQLKILGQLGNQEAKMQLTQVITAQKQVEKAQEQLDIAKIQEERAREGFDAVRIAVTNEMAVIEQANIERRDLLQKVIEANNTNTLQSIENQAQLFADQNSVFREVGDQIVQGVSQAINARTAMFEAQTSLNNFNTAQSFGNQVNGFIPNFANGNLSAREAAGLLHAASREKKAMPNGAQLAIANTKEAIIPMYKNFAGGNDSGSSIAAGINSIRNIDQTMVAAIAHSVTNSLSQIKSDNGSEQSLDKIAGLLIDLNTSVGQVLDSNLAIKTNTAGLTTSSTGNATGVKAAAAGQEVKITLQTNQNNTVQITGLENLRDQLKQALVETTDKQVAQQIEALMVQLDPIFQALNERGIISSFGQSR